MPEPTVQLFCGDCLEILPTLAAQSVDAVITDPPYPHIKRDYGYWTEAEWWAMMMPVVAETRRILKPTGSAVFILQPNSEKVGRMRGWLWEFMAWVCREWNMVQDVWWWNIVTMPTVHNTQYGLMRGSVKACVWAGGESCYRNQSSVLWAESDEMTAQRLAGRLDNGKSPSGHTVNRLRMIEAAQNRGGVTPFNILPIPNTGGAHGHGGSTPFALADWWTRYICPPGGTVADWFMGSGTMGIAAVQNGCNFVGIEKWDKPGYFPTAQGRIAKAGMQAQPRLPLDVGKAEQLGLPNA